MKDLEKALWEDYEDVSNQIKDSDTDSENYVKKLEERDNIRNELLELKKLDHDKQIKMLQTDNDKKSELIKNLIYISSFSINMLVCIGFGIKTFKFDETSTVTSTMGRGVLNNFIPKLFKR